MVSKDLKKQEHYMVVIDGITMNSIQVIKAVLTPEEQKGFYEGNVLKYVLRHKKKGGLEDLKKAKNNLEWLIELMEDMEHARKQREWKGTDE